MIQFIRQHGEVILEILAGLIETFNEKAQSKIWME